MFNWFVIHQLLSEGTKQYIKTRVAQRDSLSLLHDDGAEEFNHISKSLSNFEKNKRLLLWKFLPSSLCYKIQKDSVPSNLIT